MEYFITLSKLQRFLTKCKEIFVSKTADGDIECLDSSGNTISMRDLASKVDRVETILDNIIGS